MNTFVPSSTPVPADEAATIAKERLEHTGWWLPSSATNVTVTIVDDSSFRDILDIAIIHFTADRGEIRDMVTAGGGGDPFFADGDKLNIFQQQMLAVMPMVDAFQFAEGVSKTYPFHINVVLLPNEGDTPQITVLSYYQAR